MNNKNEGLNQMKEQLVNFETAKLAKEKGFDEETYAFYNSAKDLINPLQSHKGNEHVNHIILSKYNSSKAYDSLTRKDATIYAAPTQSLLKKWLRDVHNIIVFVNPYPTTYSWVMQYNNRKDKTVGDLYNSYETALEEGLIEGLKIINYE